MEAMELKSCRFPVAILMAAGYGVAALKAAGFDAAALKAAGFDAAALKAAAFDAAALKAAGFDAAALKAAGFDAAALKAAGFDAAVLKVAGFDASSLWVTGFSMKDLEDAGISQQELTKLKVCCHHLHSFFSQIESFCPLVFLFSFVPSFHPPPPLCALQAAVDAAAARVRGKKDIFDAAEAGDLALVKDHVTADPSCVNQVNSRCEPQLHR